MSKKFIGICIIFVLLITAWTVICKVFETPFAEYTIDYFSFFVGIFLVIEAASKILTSKDSSALCQTSRLIRISLGTCIFSIHWFQFTGM